MTTPEIRQFSTSRSVFGIMTIAAVYIYFLIFAQFAFLRLVQADGLGPLEMRWVMGAMGLAGVAASLATGRAFGGAHLRRLLLTGFAVCGMAAVLSLVGHGLWAWGGVAALIGAGLGITTVCVAASVPLVFTQAHRGIHIGLGTGLAYGFCNVPAVFSGTPVTQTILAAGICMAGALAVSLNRFEPPIEAQRPIPACMVRASGFPALVCAFLALVWLDSAAFYILQATPELNRFGWAGPSLQWTNAAVHLVAACAAGLWLDQGKMRPLLPCAFGCLAVAAILVTWRHPLAAQGTHWFYAAGVSLYSTALVFAPSGAESGMPLAAIARRAAMLYAAAGWIGSALGIGMAQDLHTIPPWVLCSSGVLIAGTVFYRKQNP